MAEGWEEINASAVLISERGDLVLAGAALLPAGRCFVVGGDHPLGYIDREGRL